MDLDFVSVHKHAKKELGQYPAILTSHLVNNPYIFTTLSSGDASRRILGSFMRAAECWGGREQYQFLTHCIVCVRSHDYDVRDILWPPCWRSENITHLVGCHTRKAQIHEPCLRFASSLAVPTTERKSQTFASVECQKLSQVKEKKPRTCPPKGELGG